ncbi:MAG TPA: PAC2 family protein [Acidimicrobiales bacterium]|nr:PAC2 family protein [Acidimicrobiales bacterium]
MSELSTVHAWPQVERPVLVVCLEGWIDAGLAASSALAHLLSAMPHELVATFDPDELIDFRARRPVLRIVNGVDKELRWSEIRLHAATNRTGRTVLVLSGPEPDMRWHRFVAEVVALASRLGVEMVFGLGAFPAPVPHTRPVRLVGTSTDGALAARVGFLPASIEVPAGMQGALEVAFGEAGIPAVGLWARVPHYVAAMPYPAASAALLDGLAHLAEIEVDTSALRAAAAATEEQIGRLIAASEEHTALVRQLEANHDNEAPTGLAEFGELPTGDEIAAELERFLRGETGG